MYFISLMAELSLVPFYSESSKKADLQCNNLGGEVLTKTIAQKQVSEVR